MPMKNQPLPIRRTHRRQFGGALLNVGLAIIVGMSVIAGAWKVGSTAVHEANLEKTFQMINTVRDGIYKAYRSRHDYSGLDTQTLYNMGSVDRGMFSSPSVIPLPVGGTLAVRWSHFTALCSAGSVSCYDSFYIEAGGLSDEICLSLVSAEFETRHRRTTVHDAASNEVALYDEPPLPGVASGACSNGTNIVRYHYY
jgi:hypothetical protein